MASVIHKWVKKPQGLPVPPQICLHLILLRAHKNTSYSTRPLQTLLFYLAVTSAEEYVNMTRGAEGYKKCGNIPIRMSPGLAHKHNSRNFKSSKKRNDILFLRTGKRKWKSFVPFPRYPTLKDGVNLSLVRTVSVYDGGVLWCRRDLWKWCWKIKLYGKLIC